MWSLAPLSCGILKSDALREAEADDEEEEDADEEEG